METLEVGEYTEGGERSPWMLARLFVSRTRTGQVEGNGRERLSWRREGKDLVMASTQVLSLWYWAHGMQIKLDAERTCVQFQVVRMEVWALGEALSRSLGNLHLEGLTDTGVWMAWVWGYWRKGLYAEKSESRHWKRGSSPSSAYRSCVYVYVHVRVQIVVYFIVFWEFFNNLGAPLDTSGNVKAKTEKKFLLQKFSP